MSANKEKIRKRILSLVGVVVVSVWADTKAIAHGHFADTPFHIVVLGIQIAIVVGLIILIARGIALDRSQ